MPKPTDFEPQTEQRRATLPSVDFEAEPHLLPFVGTADENASASGFAGQVDGRSFDDPDGNSAHSQQRVWKQSQLVSVEAAADGSARIAVLNESTAAEDLAAGLELLRRAARKASQSRDPRVEEISVRALNRLRQADEMECDAAV